MRYAMSRRPSEKIFQGPTETKPGRIVFDEEHDALLQAATLQAVGDRAYSEGQASGFLWGLVTGFVSGSVLVYALYVWVQ